MDILIFMAILYPVPMLLAWAKGCDSKGAITFISLLLGWFPFVWLICLFWAICGGTRRKHIKRAKIYAREFAKINHN
jgi:Superinfection immunity protein